MQKSSLMIDYTFISGISNYFCSTSQRVMYIELFVKLCEKSHWELHVCVFGLQRPFCISPCYDGLVDCGHSAACCRITKMTRNVNVPWYDSSMNFAHCARNFSVNQTDLAKRAVHARLWGKVIFMTKWNNKTL